MIKSTCDRCGKERGYKHQNEIDSLEFCSRKSNKEKVSHRDNYRGQEDDFWRIRLCPLDSSLCRKCMFAILKDPWVVCGGWLHEGDYPPESYANVQSPEEAKVYRYKHHGEWEEATGHWCKTMAGREWQAMKALKVLGPLEPIPKKTL